MIWCSFCCLLRILSLIKQNTCDDERIHDVTQRLCCIPNPGSDLHAKSCDRCPFVPSQQSCFTQSLHIKLSCIALCLQQDALHTTLPPAAVQEGYTNATPPCGSSPCPGRPPPHQDCATITTAAVAAAWVRAAADCCANSCSSSCLRWCPMSAMPTNGRPVPGRGVAVCRLGAPKARCFGLGPGL